LLRYFCYYRIMNNSEAISTFLALGQESRLNIFRLIVQKGDIGLTPSEIIEQLGIPNTTLSFHLKELINANLLLVERQSRNLIYRPNGQWVQQLNAFLMENCCGGKPCLPISSARKTRSR